jgi:hypothetical protein
MGRISEARPSLAALDVVYEGVVGARIGAPRVD